MATKKKTTAQKKPDTTKKKAEQETAKAKRATDKEIRKMKKQLAATEKEATAYIKKNPKKATAISAGIGAALGATAAALLVGSHKRKKGTKKKK